MNLVFVNWIVLYRTVYGKWRILDFEIGFDSRSIVWLGTENSMVRLACFSEGLNCFNWAWVGFISSTWSLNSLLF